MPKSVVVSFPFKKYQGEKCIFLKFQFQGGVLSRDIAYTEFLFSRNEKYAICIWSALLQICRR